MKRNKNQGERSQNTELVFCLMTIYKRVLLTLITGTGENLHAKWCLNCLLYQFSLPTQRPPLVKAARQASAKPSC